MGFLMEIERLAEGQQGLRVVCQQTEGPKWEGVVRPGEHKLFGVTYWTSGSASFARILEDLQEDRVTDGSYLIVAVDDAVTIVSDPLGTIPAFYHVGDSRIVVGLNMSEVARVAGAGIDQVAQELYLLFEYIPQPHTLFAGVKRCPPGTVIRIDPGKPGVTRRPYFDLGARVLERIDAAGEPHSELIHRTWRLSTEKVLAGLSREETVGISLSGGLDSRFLLGSVRELGVKCVAYTYGVNEQVSDVLIARDVAAHFNVAWQYFALSYEPEEMEEFLSRYFPMEPVSMSSLASGARHVKERFGINYTMVAAGGDVVWGSHCSIKNMVKAAKAVRMWRRYCRTWKSAWVAASELGDWGWAVGRKEWERPLQNAGKVFDETVDHRLDPVTAERLWSVQYRQPSYTWNSNLVYLDQGIKVLAPTLTLESIINGLTLPLRSILAGVAYERAFVKHYPQGARSPLTRTRKKPSGRLINLLYSDAALLMQKLTRRDWHVPWTSPSEWMPVLSTLLARGNLQWAASVDWPEQVAVRALVLEFFLRHDKLRRF